MSHEALGAMAAFRTHALVDGAFTAKSPAFVPSSLMLHTCMSAVPVLRIVTVCCELMVPTVWSAKARDDGE